MDEDFTFEPTGPGDWSVLDGVTANHEAAHSVMAVLLGVEVFEVRIDRPIARRRYALGWARMARAEDARKAVLLSIAPLVLEDRVPATLPSLMTDDGDEFDAAVVAFDSGWSEEDWSETVEIARGLLAIPSAKRALKALSGELLARGAIPGPEIKRIVNDAEALSTSGDA